MFTVTWIQRHHEMTALLAAGIPRLRVLRPVLLAAVLRQPGRRRQPRARDAQDPRAPRDRLPETSAANSEAAMQSRFDSETDILIGGDKIVAAEQKIVGPHFVLARGNSINSANSSPPPKLATCRPKAIDPAATCSAA